MMKVINVDDLIVVREGNIILSNISFDIKMGSFVSIVGANGSGKSTLIKTLAGLIDYSGYISINGFYLEDDISKIYKSVSYVFDGVDSLILGNTVYENLLIELSHLNLSDKEVDERINNICEMFDIDKSILGKNMVLLNNDLKQKIKIAAAIISEPSILILDDCLHQLSVKDRNIVIKMLNKLKKEKNITIVMVTHNMEDTLNSDRIIVMDKGKIVMDGSVREVFLDKDKIVDYGLNLPFIVDLSLELIKNKKINHIYFNQRKLVDELWK